MCPHPTSNEAAHVHVVSATSMQGAHTYHRVAASGDAADQRGIGRAEGHPHFTRWGHPSAHQPVSCERCTEMRRGDRAVTKPGGQGSSQHQHLSITHCTWPHRGCYHHGISRGVTTSYSKVRLREESVKYSIALGFMEPQVLAGCRRKRPCILPIRQERIYERLTHFLRPLNAMLIIPPYPRKRFFPSDAVRSHMCLGGAKFDHRVAEGQ
jgi:hypothetical protein